jgi:glyoxylase-like metal-dependent hydrolase (beta-lactamase superfamily II)
MTAETFVIREGLSLDCWRGALTGVLRDGEAALLLNAPSPGIGERLRQQGVRRVEKVLLSHHRRDVADGLAEVLAAWAPQVVLPAAERALFEEPSRYWEHPASRWRLLCGHVPYHATQTTPVPVAQAVRDGDLLEWRGWTIRVLSTPGYTDGSVSYVVRYRDAEGAVAFTGDLIWGPGQVRDLYSLQHEVSRNGFQVGDYHGFLGSMWALLESLGRVLAVTPEMLVPAHGVPMARPADAVALLRARFQTAYHQYVNVSALRWYFPQFFADHSADSGTLVTQETAPMPANVRRLNGTTWALLAEDRRALLIDPYSPDAVEAAAQAVAMGEIAAYDGIWLTHFHHDHVEAAQAARERFGAPVMTDRIMAEVVAQPDRFLLTCLAPGPTTVDVATADGQTWRWRGYRLTAYHFPGQTYYHSGLHVVPDRGPSLFFAGDTVTPTGIDDYCAWNRNWLGPNQGFDRCLRLLRGLRPDLIFNQHVEVGFRFSDQAYDLMLRNLAERGALFRALVPWEHSNFGTDEYWVHTDPYEQRVAPGASAEVAVRLLNHGDAFREAAVEPVVPLGWQAEPGALHCRCEPGRESVLRFVLQPPPATAAGRVVVPFRVTFGGVFLGALREAVLRLG